jgi:hypothetical protein
MTEKANKPKGDAEASPERKPLPVPEGGWPADEFTGQAGSFARDPYTGKRTRVQEPTAPRPGALD